MVARHYDSQDNVVYLGLQIFVGAGRNNVNFNSLLLLLTYLGRDESSCFGGDALRGADSVGGNVSERVRSGDQLVRHLIVAEETKFIASLNVCLAFHFK